MASRGDSASRPPGRTRQRHPTSPRYPLDSSTSIIVVNSAPDFLDLLRELLQDENYNVTTTNFVPRTFDQIKALDPDLLVVDLIIGQRAGWDLLEPLQTDALTEQTSSRSG